MQERQGRRVRARAGWKVWTALALVLLFGLFIRLWRLDFGQELPYLAHTDEPTQYNPAIQIIRTGDLNPHFFNYPSLTIYLDALVMYAGYGVGKLTGAFESIQDLRPIRTLEMSVGVVGTPSMLLLGRATTAVMGALSVGVIYGLARQVTRSSWAPFVAALLLALSQTHVRLSHYMTVDVIATAFALACVAACTAALSTGKRWLLWLGAACGGLATSSKYNYAVLSIPVALSALLDTRVRWGRRLAHLVLCGGLFGLAFALTSPFVLLDFKHASAGIQREMEHYATGHLGVTGNSMVWYLSYMWQDNPALLLLGIPGLVAALWRHKRTAVPMAVAAVAYYGLIGNQAVHFDRNVLPVMLLLMAGAATMIEVLGGWLPRRIREWGGRTLGFSPAIALLVALPLIPSLRMLPAFLQAPQPSGKAEAQAWFDRAIASPSTDQLLRPLKIAAESYTVYLDPQRYDVRYYSTITDQEGGLTGFKALKYDAVILGSGMFGRFYKDPDIYAEQVRIYDAFFDTVPDPVAFEGHYDPLDFRGSGGQVYVFFMTPKGRAFQQAMEAGP
jgi:4-amino-4-deoxy-L-arabinose transferase-like glycosyltransferase